MSLKGLEDVSNPSLHLKVLWVPSLSAHYAPVRIENCTQIIEYLSTMSSFSKACRKLFRTCIWKKSRSANLCFNPRFLAKPLGQASTAFDKKNFNNVMLQEILLFPVDVCKFVDIKEHM